MSYTDIERYEDPILKLAKDPNLNKEKDKTSKIIHIIHNFPLSERKVSKLCQLSLTLLQGLEKIELNLKNWAFLSLDINSSDHFNSSNPSDIKNFNNNVSVKVLADCKDLNRKLNKISFDLDYVTKSSHSLTPLEYISDSGTLLTSLTLRSIRLKDELSDKISVAYSKAKLITIGTDLEQMLEEDNESTNDSTVFSYKHFVVSLLKQLNNAIEMQDMPGKYECLAVINDMEQMFEAFKLERAQRQAVLYSDYSGGFDSELDTDYEYMEDDFVNISQPTPPQQPQQQQPQQKSSTRSPRDLPLPHHHKVRRGSNKSNGASGSNSNSTTPRGPHPLQNEAIISDDEDGYDDYESDYGSASMYSSSMSIHNPPLVHSITRSQQLQPPAALAAGGSPGNHSTSPQSTRSPNLGAGLGTSALQHQRRDSMSSLATTNILQKSTLTEEMPYLMSAFNSARNFEEDVSHYKEEEDIASITKQNRKNNDHNDNNNNNTNNNNNIHDSASQSKPHSSSSSTTSSKRQFPSHKAHLPDTPLYTESTILPQQSLSTPSSYLYANNSLLSKLGIRPQIITTDLPDKLGNNTSTNIRSGILPNRGGAGQPAMIGPSLPPKYITSSESDHQPAKKEDKENRRIITPLTKANLESHTSFSGLSGEENFSDDYVE